MNSGNGTLTNSCKHRHTNTVTHNSDKHKYTHTYTPHTNTPVRHLCWQWPRWCWPAGWWTLPGRGGPSLGSRWWRSWHAGRPAGCKYLPSQCRYDLLGHAPTPPPQSSQGRRPWTGQMSELYHLSHLDGGVRMSVSPMNHTYTCYFNCFNCSCEKAGISSSTLYFSEIKTRLVPQFDTCCRTAFISKRHIARF